MTPKTSTGGNPDLKAEAGIYGSIIPRIAKNNSAAMIPEAGTVMTQAAAILISADLFTNS